MQDQTIQWLSVILGSLLFLDACRWVVTRQIVAGRVGGDTPRSCYRNDNRANALVQSRQKGQHMFKFTSLLLPSKSQAHRAETTRREKKRERKRRHPCHSSWRATPLTIYVESRGDQIWHIRVSRVRRRVAWAHIATAQASATERSVTIGAGETRIVCMTAKATRNFMKHCTRA